MSQTEFRVKVILEATVSPSEDREKVAEALRNLVPGAQAVEARTSAGTSLVAEGQRALTFMRDQLRDRHVRAAARRQLLTGKKGNAASLMLNRQAAAVRVVALCGAPEESPLGPVYFTLESDRLDEAVDWLTAYAEG